MATWRELIAVEMKRHGDAMDNVIANTMSEMEMDINFYAGYGGNEGIPFTVWTEKRVYFPVNYDGAEWCASVARNPDGEPTEHVGCG